MKKQRTNLTDARILRQKAEEKLNKKESKVSSLSTESNAIKLSHELAVHQIEIVSDPEEESEIKNLKILIVDDDSTLRFILSNMVKSYAKEIFYAETGVEAIAVYKNNPDIDLILLDIHMPKMNGYETANQIKAINKDVTIIVETADSLSDITGESTREGINDYFFKPYNKTFLNQLIEKHFSRNIKGHI